MEIEPSSTIPAIDLLTLTPIVRNSTQREALHILDWRLSQLGGGVGNPVSLGLYRLEGVGQEGDEQLSWSLILKIIQSPANLGFKDMGEGNDQTHWNYWKREMFVYQSGLLDTLPEGLAAPRCWGVSELPGDVVWLWLEDIQDSYAGAWPLERYALTARHLGRLNGSYSTARPLPNYPWLSASLIRQWLAGDSLWLSFPWDHPRSLAYYPMPELNSFRRMLLEIERFQVRLNQLPKTVCHGDTYPTNFMSRSLPAGQEQTVALDWALVGISLLGDDLGQLVLGAYTTLKNSSLVDVDQVLFNSYMEGLRESGCQVEAQRVRFGCSTLAALRVGLFKLFLLNDEIEQGSADTQETIAPVESPDCFEVFMADHAFELLDAK